MQWVSAAPGGPGHLHEENHPNQCVHTAFTSRGLISFTFDKKYFFPQNCYVWHWARKKEHKYIFFCQNPSIIQTTGRVKISLLTSAAKQHSCFNTCNLTSWGHFWEYQWDPSALCAVLTENLDLYSKVLLLLWSTQGVQRWVSHSPSQPPDAKRDGAYIKSIDSIETF